mmetsp:Transcript_98267/g.300475  ORF Transcript_98267/g.300475 Transcript_98267/m.300475 type:complete len:303 (-) Transcript_98267:331-1239(-)
MRAVLLAGPPDRWRRRSAGGLGEGGRPGGRRQVPLRSDVPRIAQESPVDQHRRVGIRGELAAWFQERRHREHAVRLRVGRAAQGRRHVPPAVGRLSRGPDREPGHVRPQTADRVRGPEGWTAPRVELRQQAVRAQLDEPRRGGRAPGGGAAPARVPLGPWLQVEFEVLLHPERRAETPRRAPPPGRQVAEVRQRRAPPGRGAGELGAPRQHADHVRCGHARAPRRPRGRGRLRPRGRHRLDVRLRRAPLRVGPAKWRAVLRDHEFAPRDLGRRFCRRQPGVVQYESRAAQRLAEIAAHHPGF